MEDGGCAHFLNHGDGFTRVRSRPNSLNCDFNYTQFLVRQFYLNKAARNESWKA